jgi:GT2 family glycosyltransferase
MTGTIPRGRVGFVCTNYNNAAFTAGAAASLRRPGRGADVPIVVVDNASGDADRTALRALEASTPDVRVVYSEANLGYFPGLNLGLHTLRTEFPDVAYVVIGNNDLVFPEDFIERIARYADVFEKWAVVAPDLVTPDGIHQNPHVLHPISPVRRVVWELFYGSYKLAVLISAAARVTRRFTVREENAPGSQLYQMAQPVEQGYGACYILGPEFFRHFTEFFAPTFMMQEEYFLYEQLRTIGQLTYYDPRFVVEHHGHATTRLLGSRRKWELARDAHKVYRRFRSMREADQRRWIASTLAPGTPERDTRGYARDAARQ